MVGIEHTFTFSLNLMFGLDLKECTDKYWCWGKVHNVEALSRTTQFSLALTDR